MRLVYHLGCTTLDEPSAVDDTFGGGSAPPSVDTMGISGIGDSVVLLRGRLDNRMLLSLRVQRGDDLFVFNAADAPETPDRLITLTKLSWAAQR